MSAKSNPSTGRQAELSKISETSSRALMQRTYEGGAARPPASPAEQPADRLGHPVDGVPERRGDRVEQVVDAVASGRSRRSRGRLGRGRCWVRAPGRAAAAAAAPAPGWCLVLRPPARPRTPGGWRAGAVTGLVPGCVRPEPPPGAEGCPTCRHRRGGPARPEPPLARAGRCPPDRSRAAAGTEGLVPAAGSSPGAPGTGGTAPAGGGAAVGCTPPVPTSSRRRRASDPSPSRSAGV